MKIQFGYEMVYDCPKPTPVILTLTVHASRVSDLVSPDHVRIDPPSPLRGYRDMFGNWVTRLVLPEGQSCVHTDAVIHDNEVGDYVNREAMQQEVDQLPDDVLVYLLGSRYCETDVLMDDAWRLFASAPFGWQRVQAICDFVHQHVVFGYEFARPTKTAAETYKEKTGVCRDFTHLAVAFCRCMNIPARYCAGYLPNISQQLPQNDPPDFAAWFEAYLDGRWYVFDPRNNLHLQGRILIAQGRDATDVAISNAFGDNSLVKFQLHARQI